MNSSDVKVGPVLAPELNVCLADRAMIAARVRRSMPVQRRDLVGEVWRAFPASHPSVSGVVWALLVADVAGRP